MANTKSKKSKKKTVRPTSKLVEFHKTSRAKKLRGSIYILIALYFAVSIISFFVSWPNHDNWLGMVGFWFSYHVVQKTFGICSLGFSFLFFIRGLRRWNVEVPAREKILWPTLFWMLWLSTVIACVCRIFDAQSDTLDNYAGVVGTYAAASLYRLIKWGTAVFLLFVAVVMLIFVHKVRFRMPKVSLPEMPKVNLKESYNKLVAAAKDDDDDKDSEEIDEAEEKTAKEDESRDEKKSLGSIFADPFAKFAKSKNETETIEEKVEDVKLTIDDEFSRINAKAQGEDVTNQAEAETPVPEVSSDIDFTIAETSAMDSQNNNAELPHYSEFETTHTTDHYTIDELYDPHLDLKMYLMPQTDILTDWETKNVKVTKEELVANKDHIVETLRNYGIEIVGITASPGPTVTLYEIKPAPGVRISKIKSLEDDIALSLSALGIRIIAPIPGRGTVGIEVPNANPQIVSMKNMLECDAFQHADKMELPIVFGKTISNDPFVTDLAKMPHLLMAGATGTGKSVGLNAVIASLLYKKHPSELKFVMVDPKKVELSLYNKIERHYLAKLPDSEEPIITDVKKVVRTLNSLCIEMDQRYDLLKTAGVRKITEYNEKFIQRQLNPENGHRFLPYIVLVVDEFADLIMTAGKEVEMPICRLAQLARAVGIHLIIATQRPTTNIITGTIKANFPARVAFKVTSGIDSRTILDCSGAQRLIGRGDMLISLSGSDLVRIQCALIETKEIEELADFIGSQRGYPDGFLLPEYLDENEEPNKDFDPKQKDEFFNDAARLVVASQFGSTSLLQRKLQLGYNRAGRIIDQLEAAGIVGPYNGSKARDVLVHDEVQLEEILRSL